MKQRHQVFVSSVYRGLEDARQQVIQGILKLDCIPTAMEFFGASHRSSWEVIKSLIDEADYLLVVLGGSVGTIHPDTGIPITEMEYDYASARGIPIACLVHPAPDTLPADLQESLPERQEAFQRFKTKLSDHLWDRWTDVRELKGGAIAALTALRKDYPRPGWIPSPNADLLEGLSQQGLTRIYEYRDEAIPAVLRDISCSQRSCWISAALYVDKLIKRDQHDAVVEALVAAGKRADASGHQYELSFCSLSPDMSGQGVAGSGNAAILTAWQHREKDDEIASLIQRIERGSSDFNLLAGLVSEACPSVCVERRYFHGYLVPHSLVVIDDSIVYVSFYDWSRQSGRSALTMRFEGGKASARFVSEARKLKQAHSHREYKVLAFDFDGVVANSMVSHADAWWQAIRAASLPEVTEERILANLWTGAAGPRMFDGCPGDTPRSALREVKDRAFDALRPGIRPFDGAAFTLGKLKERGFVLALATTAKRPYLETFLREHALEGYFDCVLADSDVSKPKPDPEMLREIGRRTSCLPWELCMVGDTSTDYTMSRRFGSDFILFESHDHHGVPGSSRSASNWAKLGQLLAGAGVVGQNDKKGPRQPDVHE